MKTVVTDTGSKFRSAVSAGDLTVFRAVVPFWPKGLSLEGLGRARSSPPGLRLDRTELSIHKAAYGSSTIRIDPHEHACAMRMRLIMWKRLALQEVSHALTSLGGIHRFQAGRERANGYIAIRSHNATAGS